MSFQLPPPPTPSPPSKGFSSLQQITTLERCKSTPFVNFHSEILHPPFCVCVSLLNINKIKIVHKVVTDTTRSVTRYTILIPPYPFGVTDRGPTNASISLHIKDNRIQLVGVLEPYLMSYPISLQYSKISSYPLRPVYLRLESLYR